MAYSTFVEIVDSIAGVRVKVEHSRHIQLYHAIREYHDLHYYILHLVMACIDVDVDVDDERYRLQEKESC
jgi:hypothetical protein